MPKSKRDKIIPLTKVKKKKKENKKTLISDIRQCVDEYQTLILLSIENMRSTKFMKIRQEFKTDSRIFFGKNHVMSLALGRIAEDEYRDGLRKISDKLHGQCALMFTNRDVSVAIQYLNDFREIDFSRAGNSVDETVMISAGPLEQFPFSIEPQLRKLGLPTQLKNGVVTLLSDFVICTKGDAITPEQSRILKLFDYRFATFSVLPIAQWTKKGYFKLL